MVLRTIDRLGLAGLRMALATAVMSCVAGPALADSETRTTEPFHAVSFEGSWTVDVVVGKESSVRIEGDKDILPLVKTEVADGELHIKIERDSFSIFGRRDLGALTVHIVVPQLTAFMLQGSGNASVAGLNGGTTEFTVSGSGDLTAAGKLDALALVVNGSGQADLSGLVAEKASATINGSGKATVHPSASLAAMVNGSGHVNYLGDGARITSVVHGSGQVEKR
jgi:Putative auto-transporter adhesin, head GIN domain